MNNLTFHKSISSDRAHLGKVISASQWVILQRHFSNSRIILLKIMEFCKFYYLMTDMGAKMDYLLFSITVVFLDDIVYFL